MTTKHNDRTQMNRHLALTEADPYSEDPTETRFRSQWEIEEWVYEQAYDSENIEEFHRIAPSEVHEQIGRAYVEEGEQAAKNVYHEFITETIEIKTNEELSNYVDGQMRLFAGYDVAKNGDTLSEGNYSTWQELRRFWEMGVRDKLMGKEKWASI